MWNKVQKMNMRSFFSLLWNRSLVITYLLVTNRPIEQTLDTCGFTPSPTLAFSIGLIFFRHA